MTPQEAQIIRDIFARVRQMGPAPRDPDAHAAIDHELRSNPDAVIGLVRAVVALDRERAGLLEEIERLRGGEQDDHEAPGYGGPYGHEGYRDPRGYGAQQEDSGRDPWSRSGPSTYERPDSQRPDPRWEPQRPAEAAREPWGSPPWGRSRSSLDTRPMPPQAPQPGPWGGRTEPAQGGAPGGGILGTVAGAAAGMAGGLFAYEALKGVLGGSNQGGGLFGSANASESKDQGSESGFETGGSMDDGGGDFFGLGDLFDDN